MQSRDVGPQHRAGLVEPKQRIVGTVVHVSTRLVRLVLRACHGIGDEPEVVPKEARGGTSDDGCRVDRANGNIATGDTIPVELSSSL